MNHGTKIFALLFWVPLLCWAVPGTLENLNYKVTLSETTPGVDDSLVPGVDPLINVNVQDKVHGSGTQFPLKVYAIQEYFFSDNLLNLITRNTPKSSMAKPLYGFLQLNLDAPNDSRQYNAIRKYYFSTDNRALVASFAEGTDSGPGSQALGLIRWGDKPASLGWIYSITSQVNLLKSYGVQDGRIPQLEGEAGWTADSLTAAFMVSFSGGQASPDSATPDPASKTYYLVRADLGDNGIKVAAAPVDGAALRLQDGGTVDKVSCMGDQATVTVISADGTDTRQVQIPLPVMRSNE